MPASEQFPIDIKITPDPAGRRKVEDQLEGIERRADLTEKQMREATKLRPDLAGASRVEGELRGLNRRADVTERKFRDATKFRPDVAGYARINRQMDTLQAQALRTRQLVASIAFGAITGVGAAAFVNTWADFGRAMSRVSAIARSTEEEFKALRLEALRLGRTTEFTATDAANGLTFLAQAGFTASQALIALEPSLNLATAGQIGLARSADLASNILSGFGYDVNQLERVVDVMALTAASANTNIEQLGQAMSFAAPVAANFGVEVEEASAAIGVLGNSGIQASRAGTSLNAALARLASGRGRYFQQTLRQLGLEMSDVSVRMHGFAGVLENLDEAGATIEHTFALVGREAGGAFQKLIEGSDDVRELTAELYDADGAATQMAGTIRNDLRGSLDSAKSAWEGLVIAIGDNGAANTLRSWVDSATNLFRYLTENIELVSQAFTALAILIGSRFVLGAFRTLGNVVGGIGTGLVNIFRGGIVSGLGSIAGSFVSIAGASAGVIGAMSAFRETFQASDNGAVRRIGDTLDAMVETINTLVNESLPDFLGFERDFDGLLGTFEAALKGIIDATFGVVDYLINLKNKLNIFDLSPDNLADDLRISGGIGAARRQIASSQGSIREFEADIAGNRQDIQLEKDTIKDLEDNRDYYLEKNVAVDYLLDLARKRIADFEASTTRILADIETESQVITNALARIESLENEREQKYGGSNLQQEFRDRVEEINRRTENAAASRALGYDEFQTDAGRNRPDGGGKLNRPPIESPPTTTFEGGQIGSRRLLSEEELDAQYALTLDRNRELANLTRERQGVETELFALQDEYAKNQIALSDDKIQKYREEFEAIRQMENRFQTLQEIGESVFDRIGDAVEDFARRGEIDFENLVSSMLLQLARLGAESLTSQLSEGLGSVLSTIFGGSGAKGTGGFGGKLADSLGAGVPKANQGGVLTVRGSGGTDNNILSLNGYPVKAVSAGEKIATFQRGTHGLGGAGGGVTVNNYTTINAEAGDREGIENALDARDAKLTENIIGIIDRRNYTNA